MLSKFTSLTAALLASVFLAAPSLAQVEAELVSLTEVAQPGESFEVALRLDHEPHWHTYWKNPGTGLPTSIEWELPEGWRAGEIRWPTPIPIRDSSGQITGNGYEGRTYLPVTLAPPDDLPLGETVILKARADWLMCADVCIPGGSDLELIVRTGVSTGPTADAEALLETVGALPQPIEGISASAYRKGESVEMVVSGLRSEPNNPWFFEENAFIEFSEPQASRYEQGALTLTLPVSNYYDGPGERLVGVLRQAGDWMGMAGQKGLAIDVMLGVEGAGPLVGTSTSSLAFTLGLAFVGGMILNLMPCVFPVLGIKVLGFVNQAGSDRRKVALHGWVFSGGVLSSFLVLASVLAVLRAGGDQLGWGFQLQSPAFVFVLACVLLVFAMSMSGVFEFGLGATGVGSGLQSKEGFGGSFFTGVLATVVATPCSAPFLAPALGAALALPLASSYLVFSAIAVGLSTPYLVLSLFPSMVNVLPRPGAWMETFKEVMAFPLYATVGYLIWVLMGQTTESGSLMALFGLTALALAVWFYGRYNRPGASLGRKRIGLAGGVLIALFALYLGWPKAPQANDVVWKEWSPAAVTQALEDGHPVYVDFTARWCATCQTNKKIVFGSNEVKDSFKEKGVVTLRADWTNSDSRITEELARWNRSAVPFNLIYLPGVDDPVVLPELLTPGVVLDALRGES